MQAGVGVPQEVIRHPMSRGGSIHWGDRHFLYDCRSFDGVVEGQNLAEGEEGASEARGGTRKNTTLEACGRLGTEKRLTEGGGVRRSYWSLVSAWKAPHMPPRSYFSL